MVSLQDEEKYHCNKSNKRFRYHDKVNHKSLLDSAAVLTDEILFLVVGSEHISIRGKSDNDKKMINEEKNYRQGTSVRLERLYSCSGTLPETC